MEYKEQGNDLVAATAITTTTNTSATTTTTKTTATTTRQERHGFIAICNYVVILVKSQL